MRASIAPCTINPDPTAPSVALSSLAQVVFPKTLQLAFPFIVITCEMLACTSSVYMNVKANATATSGSFADIDEAFGECEGVMIGCLPMLFMLGFVYLSQVLYVDSETAFNVTAIARFRFGLVKLFQLAMFGSCSVYAVVM